MSRKQYDETNSGALFKNDRKEKDTHPDLSGRINVEGKEYWLSGWTKKGDDGKFKVLSLSLKPKDQQAPQKAREAAFRDEPQRGRRDEFDDDDIGF